MARWFRSHAAKLDNPKVQKLSDMLYRAWDSLLCVACQYDGVLPSLEDTAFALRKTKAVAAKLIDALITAGLFVKTERGVEPHEWNIWQYKSDVSTERVKRFRERSETVPRNVFETPSESEADTDTDLTNTDRVERGRADALATKKGAGNGTRLPDGWRPDVGGRAFASDHGLDPDATADAFADWWAAASGAKAVKRDWNAAFRTWCRRDTGIAASAGNPRPFRAARGNDAVFEHLAVIANRGGD